GSFFAFASERLILASLVDRLELERTVGPVRIEQLPAFRAMLVSLRDLARQEFACVPRDGTPPPHVTTHPRSAPLPIVLHTKSARDLKRCIKCLLPETYPFVKFDAQGVCAYCCRWKSIKPKGRRALEEVVE